MLKDYYQLAKPGIIGGNLVSTAGGFFLASGGHFHALLFLSTMLGAALIVASGCVINNYYDRDIDALMPRTKGRMLVQQTIHPSIIGAYALVLGVSGFLLLWLAINLLTAFLGLLGFITYVFFYTIWLKRKTPISTLVGSVSGAAPPVMGYCAVTGSWDAGATCLFMIFCLWQMPHHYAIGIYRLHDYMAAKIPVLPAVKGTDITFRAIIYYIIVFWAFCCLLTFMGYTGYYYLVGTSVVNAWWLSTAIKTGSDDNTKARRLFFQSIWVVTLNSILMSVNSLA